MAKRMLMVLLFVGAIGAMSLVAPNSAEARRCSRGFYGGGHGHHFHGGPVYSRSFYRGGYYAPYRGFGPGYYGPGCYGGNSFYYGGHRGGLYIGF